MSCWSGILENKFNCCKGAAKQDALQIATIFDKEGENDVRAKGQSCLRATHVSLKSR